ncbi:MAG: DEAD/DEAH box helicase, partial [Myxococcales bacterium]|nr:DEAD/DEAH box helicase [Myxococcales bacterium]
SYARMVGLSAFKWHGDVPDAQRRAFRASPSHILMTTPESLEVMMISEKTDVRALMADLQVVIIDEIHAFAGDDRGAHLAALLERLAQMVGTDFQRIGLSATVGNPQTIGAWMQGSSARRFCLVDPEREPPSRDVCIDLRADVEDAAVAVASLARGKKSLVFVESRSRAEKVAHALEGRGVEVFIHHSSVSRGERQQAEVQFAYGENTAIVCTATMELGIDVGDLDQVIQFDAPASVASFLQRLGRTGRRAGRRANTTFLCTTSESLLQAVAIAQLADAGWVENVRPAEHAVHILAHQVMALCLQEHGVSRHRILDWVQAAFPFNGIGEEELTALLETMLARQILYEADGLLTLGVRGEKLYGRKNFFELYAVFNSPPVFRVTHGREEVGYIQARFVQGHDEQKGPLCFRLGGRAWQVAHVDWARATMQVRPADAGMVPNWLGLPSVLSRELCQAMRATLVRESVSGARLTSSAEAEIQILRQSYGEILSLAAAPIESTSEGVQWHTFAGGAINRLLAAGMEQLTGRRWAAGNLTLKSKEASLSEARTAIRALGGLEWESLAFGKARDMARGVVTKFQPCLPLDAENRLLAEKLLDIPGTLRFVAQVASADHPATASGIRIADHGVDDLPDLSPEMIWPKIEGAFQSSTPTHWVDTQEGLAALCAAVSKEEVIALDVETALDFSSLCLVQFGTRQRVWIIDALQVVDLGPLSDLLADPRVVKVIHNARFERRILAKEGLSIVAVFDTMEASRARHGKDVLGGHSLGAVVARELGVQLDKREQISNWARRPLTPQQLAYAAADVEVLLQLWDVMHESLPLLERTLPESDPGAAESAKLERGE